MSTLKTNNIEHLDASTPSIQTTIGGGTILAGVSTVSGALNVGSGTSISSPATNTLTLGTNSVERLRITSDGKVGIGTDNPSTGLHLLGSDSYFTMQSSSASGNAGILFKDSSGTQNGVIFYDFDDDFLKFSTNNDTEALRITSAGRLLKGWESTAFSGTGQSSDIAIAGTSSNNGLQVIRYNTSFGAYGLTIGRSKNGTIGTHGQVVSGNDIGFVSFVASDGTNWRGCADIAANADGNITSSSAEGKLIFKTTKSGSTTPTQAMTIKANHNVEIHDGNLVFETSGTGIDFSATSDGSGTTTSELLDDYEEGTFTPTVTGLTNGNVMTLDSAIETMRYIKVGRKVTLFGRIRITSKNSATGSIQLGAFPFTSDNTGPDQSNFAALQLVLHGFSLPANANGVVFAEFQGNQTSANVYCVRDNNSWTNLDSSNVNTSVGAYMYITGSYYANS